MSSVLKTSFFMASYYLSSSVKVKVVELKIVYIGLSQ